MKYEIPQSVIETLQALQKAGFEAYIVGGCVRDLLLGRTPKDWDITTNAKPEDVTKIFPESFYENDFGTVGVKVPRFSQSSRATTEGSPTHTVTSQKEEKEIIEVTTYRIESEYTDKRRPKEVLFTQSLEEDLARRDFTVNAIALGKNGEEWQIIDPFHGQQDLGKKVIRTVGNPEERFSEDALRLMRAIRFYAELSDPKNIKHAWTLDQATLDAVKKLSENITHISTERIRDELSKIILSGSPALGIDFLQKTGLLKHILPELEEGIGVGQNLHHIYTVWEHNLRALETCPSKKLEVRLAALLHDVAKPRTKRGNGYRSTFYNHDHVGARMTRAILSRLRFPKEVVEKSTLLVDNHLFYYNVGEVSEASVRRLIRKVGLENMKDLMDVRIGDRLGSGTPKAKPYKLRHLEYMIEKVSKDPVSVKMLAVKGTDLMESLEIPAGPKIGAILDVLLAEVIEDPAKNSKEILLARSKELLDRNLEELWELAKEKIEEKRGADDEKIKKRHWVE